MTTTALSSYWSTTRTSTACDCRSSTSLPAGGWCSARALARIVWPTSRSSGQTCGRAVFVRQWLAMSACAKSKWLATERGLGRLRERHVHVEHTRVQHRPIPQRGPHRAVQTVLQVNDALPPDRVREQVAVERRVLRQQPVQRQHGRGGDQFVEADLPGWNLRPLPMGQAVVGVGPAVTDSLEDHRDDLGGVGVTLQRLVANDLSATRRIARAVLALLMPVK